MNSAQTKYIVVVILAALAIGSTLSGKVFLKNGDEDIIETVSTSTQDVVIDTDEYSDKIFLVPLSRYFDESKLSSKAVYVQYRDADGLHDIFRRESDIPKPLASVTKTMTAITALQYADLLDTVDITSDAIAQEGDHGLREGTNWPLDKALSLMMQSSSNDMAYAVQESISGAIQRDDSQRAVVNVFVKEMNRQAELLGLRDTFFVDAIGFDTSERLSGSYGTPEDVATMLWHVVDLYPEIAANSVVPKSTYTVMGEDLIIKNTDPLLNDYPEIIFSKTGFTDLAGGNLAIVVEVPEGKLAIVLLGATFSGRFEDAKMILEGIHEWSEFAF